MKKLFITLLLLSIFFIGENYSQDYKSAIGGKAGYGLIASYKKFLSEKSAIDLFGGLRWGGLAAGAYFEIHEPIESVDRLKWYYGAGGSITTWSYGLLRSGGYYELGISGVVGLDYSFEDIPLNLSVDYAPTIVVLDSYDDTLLSSLNRLRFGYGALSLRYILDNRK